MGQGKSKVFFGVGGFLVGLVQQGQFKIKDIAVGNVFFGFDEVVENTAGVAGSATGIGVGGHGFDFALKPEFGIGSTALCFLKMRRSFAAFNLKVELS